MIDLISIFGVPVDTWHAFVVEIHTGFGVFAFLAVLAMVLTDIVVRGKPPTEQVEVIRRDADAIAYLGSIGAVFFLILSGITGYLILPYSILTSQDIYLNKSLVALGALAFWAFFAFIRYWEGPQIWKKKGLYALGVVTAIGAIFFTTIAGSIGAEISPYGESVMQPIYSATGINLRQIQITQTDVYVTVGLMVVAIVVVGFLSMRGVKPQPTKVPASTK